MEAIVRPAGERDLDALVALIAAVAEEGRWIGAEAPVDRAERRARLAAMLSDERALLLAADAGGQVVGHLAMRVAPYGVADLAMLVSRSWRGRGTGGALLAAGVAWARGAGAHKVSLQVWPHNTAAIALYEKFGFEREGLLRRHYRRRNGEVWGAVVMGLLLEGGH